jgi:hypothetical protein
MHCKGKTGREQTEETRNSAFKIHKKRFPATLKLERRHERSQQRGNQQRQGRPKIDFHKSNKTSKSDQIRTTSSAESEHEPKRQKGQHKCSNKDTKKKKY